MKNAIYYTGRFLQVVGMAIVLIGIFLSIEEGIRETGTSATKSMVIEVQYLMYGGGAFLAGVLLSRLASK